MSSRAGKSYSRQVALRSLAILAGALVLLGALGATGYYLFTGWRARDLAAKAKESFVRANYRLAWLQISSAKDLRGGDPDVLRVLALIEGAMGRATALDHYEKLAEQTDLAPEDLRTRAEIALRFGDDTQFAAAVAALENSGETAGAGALRISRAFRKGDLVRAIGEARAAAEVSEDPALRFALARLLVHRYRSEFRAGHDPSAEALVGSAEAASLIDSLLDTPQRSEALAFALNEVNTVPQNRQRWAAVAMEKVETDNPALLPAAAAMIAAGQATREEMLNRLKAVYAGSDPARKVVLAAWLLAQGDAAGALVYASLAEAARNAQAFLTRTEALFATENLDGVLAAVESGGNIDADVRLSVKARVEYARGRGPQGGAQALREAMDAAAKARRLESVLATADSLGAFAIADEKLAELCGDPAVADYAFRLARDRFSRRGRSSLLAASYERARVASPQSPAVQDYLRYLALIGDGSVILDESAAACAAEPANTTFRITHTLNLLENNRPAEALKTFDDLTVFADRLPPNQLAVIAAVLAANGEMERARAAMVAVDPELLSPGEYALLLPQGSASVGGE